MTSNSLSTATNENPLAEASPQSLEEYFSKAPPYSDAEIYTIVTELRRKREVWKVADAQGKRPKAEKAPKGGEAVNLEELGL